MEGIYLTFDLDKNELEIKKENEILIIPFIGIEKRFATLFPEDQEKLIKKLVQNITLTKKPKLYKYKSIECQHITLKLDTSIKLNDYYPLTEIEIKELLDESLNSTNPSMQQVRLNQAIPGIKCPREIEGEVSKKCDRINSLFVKGIELNSFLTVEKKLLELCK